jgi:dipeptidyl aminopeptidase/acylaminoacyl peptidase
VQVTDTPQAVAAFEWSPDSTRLLLLLRDPTAAERAAHEQGDDYEEDTPPPWVIDRQQFKLDNEGYLDRRRRHVYVLDLDSGALTQLTHGDYDAEEPAWSPDGTRIAFTSNRSADPDGNYNTDIWVVSADSRAAPQDPARVTTGEGPDTSPAWSPDGRLIAHTSVTDPAAMLYATAHLAVSSATGGETRVLTEALDRMVFQPRFAADGRQVWFLLEDSGEQNLARIRPGGGKIERVVAGRDVVYDYHVGGRGQVAALVSRPQLPPEVFLLDGSKLAQRSFVNRDVLEAVTLGDVVDVAFTSADGTPIEGFVIKPAGFVEGRRYPAILDIHGGPQSQYDFSFSFEAQLYAANGYLVIHPNPRGSTGYGQSFCRAIWQDWGGPDFEDVMAAVDDAVARGWADPDRLAVMGWSYGGILTNHVITKTDRFKAAITGASEVLYVVNYGHDQYQRWWEQELGLPWQPEARAIYERMSPFNRVEAIVTPTLVMGGEADWNVPIINSEQLYLALRRLGVETELVVYPDEYHGIETPTHIKDLYQRHLDWFGKHLAP